MQGQNIVGVQFRKAGKIYDFSGGLIELQVGDSVVVETDRGPSLGYVARLGFQLPDVKSARSLKPILRRASERELSMPARLSDEEVMSFSRERILELELNMNLLKAEVQFGGNKVLLYFSAPGRVDFRELVKELARGLKTRVELKQVGARDETKLLGGVGICGREYCCSSFLREFVPVSIRMAKNQNLALNPSKVSGGCGRLLCCLTYENDTYSWLKTKLPPKGSEVRVLEAGEDGKVVKADLLNQKVIVELSSGVQTECKLSEIELLDKKSSKKEPSGQADVWGEDLDLDELEAFADQGSQAKSAKPRSGDSNSGQNRNANAKQGSSPRKQGERPKDTRSPNKSKPADDQPQSNEQPSSDGAKKRRRRRRKKPTGGEGS